MDSRKFQGLVDEVLGVLGKIVNLKAFPFLRVLYFSLFYFMKRGKTYRNAVRAIPVGPRSRIVVNKSRRFVEEFLAQHAPFALEQSDERARRRAFSSRMQGRCRGIADTTGWLPWNRERSSVHVSTSDGVAGPR